MALKNTYIESWSKSLGLLPIPLFQNQKEKDQQFILLNGQANNFCIDFDSIYKPEEYKSFAWSSGVDSFLNIKENDLFLYRWYKPTAEKINLSTVNNNIDAFYDYIGKSKSNKENSIIFYTIRIFNKLRTLLKQEDGGPALQAFLYLLASLNQPNVNLKTWGLSKESKIIVDSIDKSSWEMILNEFKNGMASDGLLPDVNLILRHTAGRLFEEAHFSAFINYQLTLFGPSEELIFKEKTPQQYGAYFTPSYVARSIVEEVLASYTILPGTLTIFDPACGSSEFLVESLRQLKRLNYQGNVKIIGWDESETAILMSKFILTYEMKEWNNKVTIELKKANSLIESNQWPDKVDILLMNPPFRSWELMSSEKELRDQVKKVLGSTYSKNPNQAAAFFKLAISSLKKNGKLGCLLPSALFSSDSHKGLRILAAESLHPLIIARLGSFIFDNALVDACMFVAENNKSEEETKIVWTQNIAHVTSKALRELRKLHYNATKLVIEPDQYSIYNVNNPLKNSDSWMPVSFEAASLKLKVEDQVHKNKLVTIGKVFDVHRGADPGRKYFKISKEVFAGLGQKEKMYFRPCVESINIKNGKLVIINYLFFPKTEGLIPLNSEEELKKAVPIFYNNLLAPNKGELKKRVITGHWWELQRHRKWQIKKYPKLVSAAFGKAGDFAIDETGDFVVEQSCAWLPIAEDVPLDILYSYLSIFCTDLFNSLLKSYSKQLAGGEWFNLQTKHVNNIPVPDFFNQQSYASYLSQLSTFGKQISKGKFSSKSQLEKLVREIYNIH